MRIWRRSRKMGATGNEGWVRRGVKALRESREVEPIGNRRMRL